jgi:hypothetical protein
MIQIKFTSTDRIASWFQGALLLVGAAAFTFGMREVWRPLGFIVGGVLLFGLGLLMNKITENK